MKNNSLLNQMEVFDMATSAKLTPNQYYLLCCMHDTVTPLRMNLNLELRSLVQDKWVIDGKLQPKAITLIKKIERLFKIQKKKTSTQLMNKNYKENILVFRNIFPNEKLPSGKAARSAIGNLETCFRWFFDNHEYDWGTILKATELYVSEFDYDKKYMTCSQYFIRKQPAGTSSFISKLADYCDFIKSGGEVIKKATFSTKVV